MIIRPRLKWQQLRQVLAQAGFKPSDSEGHKLHRPRAVLQRKGNHIYCECGSRGFRWAVDLEGADEESIENLLNRALGAAPGKADSEWKPWELLGVHFPGACDDIARIAQAGRGNPANRPLRRLLWALRYRLFEYQRWAPDPALPPALRRTIDLLCAAALLDALDPARIKQALVQVGEIEKPSEERPYQEWCIALKEILRNLPGDAAAPDSDSNPPNDSDHAAVEKARRALAEAISALTAMNTSEASPPALIRE
jgi:hypothetical protein